MDTSFIFGGVALITGASSGIGKALAFEFGANGINLILVARRYEKLKEVAEQIINKYNVEVYICEADVTNQVLLKKKIQESIDYFKRLDIVVANAGYGVNGYFETLTSTDFENQFNVNIYGVLNTLQCTLEKLKISKGRIVLTGSVGGYLCAPGGTAYAMSKSAIHTLAQGLMFELKDFGISVTLAVPGFVDSEIWNVDNYGNLVSNNQNAPQVPQKLKQPANLVAKKIFNSTMLRKREVITSKHAKFFVYMQRFFPRILERLFMYMIKSMNAKLTPLPSQR